MNESIDCIFSPGTRTQQQSRLLSTRMWIAFFSRIVFRMSCQSNTVNLGKLFRNYLNSNWQFSGADMRNMRTCEQISWKVLLTLKKGVPEIMHNLEIICLLMICVSIPHNLVGILGVDTIILKNWSFPGQPFPHKNVFFFGFITFWSYFHVCCNCVSGTHRQCKL